MAFSFQPIHWYAVGYINALYGIWWPMRYILRGAGLFVSATTLHRRPYKNKKRRPKNKGTIIETEK